MNRQKIFSKFRHYWLTDDNFRGTIYRSHIASGSIVFWSGEQYWDYSLYCDIFRCKNNPSLEVVRDFLPGLVGRFRRDIYSSDALFLNFGNGLNLNDNFVPYWRILLSQPEQKLFSYLSSVGYTYYVQGKFDALRKKPISNEILSTYPLEQSYYLFGRDFILNSEKIRLFLELKSV